MPTSKEPAHTAWVSEALIMCARANPNILCNLRFGQRPIPPGETDFDRRVRETHYLISDQPLVHEPVRLFLKSLQPGSKVVMHFQGYGAELLGTAVVKVESIFWTREGYPRLDFEHSKAFERINGCPNFWGAFILAIALAPPSTGVFARRDRTGRAFVRMANRMAISISTLSIQTA